MRKFLKYAGVTVACLIVIALASALLYRAYLKHEIAEERAITSPRGINILERVRIGGIDQWIEVRGQDVNNPILLFVHGGPGIPFMPFAGEFQGPWEKYFTVVQWDQRGAGKTYASNNTELQLRTMTVPRMEEDTLEVANYLRSRFHRQKIFVLGHSWGSILGLWLAHEHPEAVYAYVGVGQAINMRENERVAYEDTLQRARQKNNQEAIQQLKDLAPYPPATPDPGKMTIVRQWQRDLLGPPRGGIPPGFFRPARILSAPEYSLMDEYGFFHGQTLSLQTMLPAVMQVDLSQLGRDFRVPIFFFEGRNDPYCRPSLVWDYSQQITAPQKAFIWFDNSGHFPFFEEQQKFTDELVHQVLPMANGAQAGN